MSDKPEKKTNIIVGFNTYLANVVVEMRKVTWPSRDELKDSTIVVLTVTGILALFTFVIDSFIGEVVKQFLK